MEWYKIEFEPFGNLFGKHYLGYYNNHFILVTISSAKLFSSDAIKYDIRLKEYLNTKKYRLLKQDRIYEIMKYRY